MKTRQPELRAIPQFDSGRWKLRLERVPVDPDNETTIAWTSIRPHKPGSTRPTRHIGSCYQSSAADASNSEGPTMIVRILLACCLVAVTVAIHSSGLALILSRLWHSPARPHPHFWQVTWLTIRIAWWLILIHVTEIAVWSLVFWWQKCLPDAESSFYFAGVTYTTVGYGDLVLPREWRLFGPLEGLTGILMCGLSTAFFFAVLSKRFGIWSGSSRT